MSNNKNQQFSNEVIAICAMNATLKTKGVASMAQAPIEAFKGVLIDMDNNSTTGVIISKKSEDIILDIYVNVVFGTRIPETAWNIQENIKEALLYYTETKVKQINIHVQGIDFSLRDGN